MSSKQDEHSKLYFEQDLNPGKQKLATLHVKHRTSFKQAPWLTHQAKLSHEWQAAQFLPSLHKKESEFCFYSNGRSMNLLEVSIEPTHYLDKTNSFENIQRVKKYIVGPVENLLQNEAFESTREWLHSVEDSNISDGPHEPDSPARLLSLIGRYGELVFPSLSFLLQQPNLGDSYIESTLKVLGTVDSPWSGNIRQAMLQEFLNHKSARVRFGAISGIAAMRVKSSIEYLIELSYKEQNPVVKGLLLDVIQDLQD